MSYRGKWLLAISAGLLAFWVGVAWLIARWS
jgi:hypothetical protein